MTCSRLLFVVKSFYTKGRVRSTANIQLNRHTTRHMAQSIDYMECPLLNIANLYA